MKNESISKYNIKKIILTSCLLTLVISVSVLFYTYSPKKIILKLKQEPETWITVFTHGTFGSLLGLLNVVDVVKDKVSGTQYKKLLSRMRKDDYFYKNQPMLKKGLITIKPTFNIHDVENKNYAVYPIAKAYETILSQLNNKKEKNFFYTFGWSGLMSQQRRRLEAVRFYNALSEEIQNYKQKGINPKIRIIAHSHGGNLALNLEAIKKALQDEQPKKNQYASDDEKDSIQEMIQSFGKLKTIPEIKPNGKKKNPLDYLPNNKNLVIDELLMFGTPIQPETESFVFSNFFKKVYNFYSQEDSIQKLDFVTTKRYFSNQRFSLFKNFFGKEPKINSDIPQVIQAKIMIRENMPLNIPDKKNNIQSSTLKEPEETEEVNNFWSNLFYFIKKTKDPDHKELWFSCWEKNDLLAPLPAIVLCPMFLGLIEKFKSPIKDIDLVLNFTKEKVHLYAFEHGKHVIKEKVSIYKWVIDQIKNKMKKWKPKESSLSKDFEVIKKHHQAISS